MLPAEFLGTAGRGEERSGEYWREEPRPELPWADWPREPCAGRVTRRAPEHEHHVVRQEGVVGRQAAQPARRGGG